MNTTRTVFGKHRQGYLIPLLLNVKPMESSFAGVMQPLPTQEHFVMCYSKSFVVSGATQESLSMMGVTPVDVDDGMVEFTRYLSKHALQELVALAQQAQDQGEAKGMRRRKVRSALICNSMRALMQNIQFYKVDQKLLGFYSSDESGDSLFASELTCLMRNGTKPRFVRVFRWSL